MTQVISFYGAIGFVIFYIIRKYFRDPELEEDSQQDDKEVFTVELISDESSECIDRPPGLDEDNLMNDMVKQVLLEKTMEHIKQQKL